MIVCPDFLSQSCPLHHQYGIIVVGLHCGFCGVQHCKDSKITCGIIFADCTNTVFTMAELEIMVRHWTFSVHFAQMSKHSSLCADIMS